MKTRVIGDARRHRLVEILETAADDEHCFERHNLTIDESLEVLRVLLVRLPILEAVRRTSESPLRAELLLHVPWILSEQHENLAEIGAQLAKDGLGPFSEADVQIFTDAFWSQRINHWLERGHFYRAWDEINKASRGIGVPEERTPESIFPSVWFSGGDVERDPSQMHISRSVLACLIERLYEQMLQTGLVEQSVTEGATYSGHTQTVVYRAPGRDGRKPNERQEFLPTPGWRLLQWLDPKVGDGPAVLPPDMQKTLLIGKYFSRLRAEKRKRRHDRLVAEYLKK